VFSGVVPVATGTASQLDDDGGPQGRGGRTPLIGAACNGLQSINDACLSHLDRVAVPLTVVRES